MLCLVVLYDRHLVFISTLNASWQAGSCSYAPDHGQQHHSELAVLIDAEMLSHLWRGFYWQKCVRVDPSRP